MPLVTTSLTKPRFVVDETSIERLGGALIDWASVTNLDADGKKYVPAGTVVSRKPDGSLQPRSFTQSITSVSVTSNVATATKTAHGYSVGEQVFISGGSLAYANGLVTIATVPDANTFTYAAVGANASATGTIVASRAATAILETDATENAPADSRSGYGQIVGGVLFANLLPDATGSPKVLPAQYRTELANAGCTFKFNQYADNR